MKLTNNQFDVLSDIIDREKNPTQRDIAKRLNKSVGTVNNTVSKLIELGYLNNRNITEKGIKALEPYRAKRAVIFAAGFGSRLVPITLNTPKPLIRVNGVRIIDTLIEAVMKASIEEIYIVRGYLAKQFDELLLKFPNIKFIDNPEYNETNNISSALCTKDLIRNAYVFEADLILYNQSLIKKYQYSTNYLGVPVDETDDWCLYTNRNKITGIGIGGTNCYHMYGISYWTKEDGKRLSKHIEAVYNSPGGKERFWDQVSLENYVDEYDITVRECAFDDIIEIDTYSELKEIDKAYI